MTVTWIVPTMASPTQRAKVVRGELGQQGILSLLIACLSTPKWMWLL